MPSIFVLAGVNGAGKSSVAGRAFRDLGRDYYNPDEATLRIQEATGCSLDQANAQAWNDGRLLLEDAIQHGLDFAFESTLGGKTITDLLKKASQAGLEVSIAFVGLASPEHHLARVHARVAAGGHDIPEGKIRERWEGSRRNIIDLMPHLAELRVFDNTAERDPATGAIPAPLEVLHVRNGTIVSALDDPPEWAKPIVERARQLAK
jgi:predicted ABC-type ATPase